MKYIKNNIKEKFPFLYKLFVKIKINYFGLSKKSYSLAGEDIVLSIFILEADRIKNGFYVDIGAYNPVRFSNTYYFYRKGWNGINIDAKPGSMDTFKRKRNRDINLEIGISKKEDKIDFYIFEESAYNTFSKDLADIHIKQGIPLDKKILLETKRLENILDQYLPANKKIDFMNIDVEGLDFEVLESNNWDKYKPSYILIEMHNINIEHIRNSNIYKFLMEKHYRLVSLAYITLIFKYEPNL